MTTHQSFLTRLRRHRRALALLDVLIGMAIFALIAVIAVIAIGQFRQRAFVTGATEDARTIGLALESAATQSGAFPTTLDADGTGDRAVVADATGAADKLGVLTRGHRLGSYTYLPATAEDGSGFRVCVEHVENGDVSSSTAEADAHAVYDSVQGGIVASGDGDCATAVAALPGTVEDVEEEPEPEVTVPPAPTTPVNWSPSTNSVECPAVASARLINNGPSTWWDLEVTMESGGPFGYLNPPNNYPQLWPTAAVYNPATSTFGAWQGATRVISANTFRTSLFTLAPGAHQFAVRSQYTQSAGQTQAKGCTQGFTFTVPSSGAYSGLAVNGAPVATAPTP